MTARTAAEERLEILRWAHIELDDYATRVTVRGRPAIRTSDGKVLVDEYDAARWLRGAMMPSYDIRDELCGGAIRKAATVNLHWWLPREPTMDELRSAIKTWLARR
jgi:hypothetical protein